MAILTDHFHSSSKHQSQVMHNVRGWTKLDKTEFREALLYSDLHMAKSTNTIWWTWRRNQAILFSPIHINLFTYLLIKICINVLDPKHHPRRCLSCNTFTTDDIAAAFITHTHDVNPAPNDEVQVELVSFCGMGMNKNVYLLGIPELKSEIYFLKCSFMKIVSDWDQRVNPRTAQ